MAKILMIAHFTRGNLFGRFEYIADLLKKNGNDVELVTSKFDHVTKKHRNIRLISHELSTLKVTLLDEPGYFKNVSFIRVLSHVIFALNLRKFLKGKKDVDLVYCAFPPICTAFVSLRYAKKRKIKLILDIQDLWPEAFYILSKNKYFAEILFSPLRLLEDYIFRSAEGIIAVSNTYLKRAIESRYKSENCKTVYLGVDLDYFDNLLKMNKNKLCKRGEYWLAYLGTLGENYDITSVIDAISLLNFNGINNIRLWLIGDGPKSDFFISYAKRKKIKVEFTGWLPYGQAITLLSLCDVAINPIKTGAANSIINKHADYSAAGLPVINTQECKEYVDMLNKFKAGINCRNGNTHEIASALLFFINNDVARKIYSLNSRKMCESLFDRKNTYNMIVTLVNKLLEPIKS